MRITLTLLFLIFTFISYAQAGNKEEVAINEFVKSELTDPARENFEIQGLHLVDLDNNNTKEIVFVWTLLGPSYWRNNLTVLKIRNDKYIKNKYVHAASLKLNGEASIINVQGDKVTLAQTIFGPNDPKCCPSIDKEITYIYENNTLKEIK